MKSSAANTLNDKIVWGAFGFFSLLAVVLHLSFSVSFFDGPIDRYDSALCSWVLAWDCYQFFGGDGRLFDANILHPQKNTLAYSEHFLGQALWVWPFRLLGFTPGGLHNAALLLAFALNGFIPFLVVRRLFRSTAAGFVAGCIYAYAPYRYGHLAHLHVEFVFWIPALFYFLIRYAQIGGAIRAAAIAVCFWQQAWASNYTLVFLFYPTAIVFGWYFVRFCREHKRILWSHLAAWIIVAGFLMYTTLPYLAVRESTGFHRNVEEASIYSANFQSYLSAPPNNYIYGGVTWTNRLGAAEGFLFPGLVTLGLFVLAGWLLWRRGRRPMPPVGEIALSSQAVRFLWIATVVTILFAMGPLIHWGTDPLFKGPMYFFHKHAIGFEGLRSYARWHIVTLAVLIFPASYAFLWLKRVIDRRCSGHAAGIIATIATCFLIVAEGYGMADYVPQEERLASQAPPVYHWLSDQSGRFAIIEYPYRLRPQVERRYMYFSCYHWKPLVNGDSGWLPGAVRETIHIVRNPTTREAANWFREHNVRYLIFHWSEYDERTMNAFERKFLADSPDYAMECRFGSDAVYRVLDAPKGGMAVAEESLKPIALGQRIQGEIRYPGQVDRFVFKNSTERDIWFLLDDVVPGTNEGGTFDPFLQLENEAGEELVSDDNSGRDDDAFIVTNLSSGIILVSGGPKLTYGKYRLSCLSQAPDPPDLREGKRMPNGALRTTIRLRGGDTFDPGVFETFVFTLARGERAIVRFLDFGGALDPAFRIWGPRFESAITVRTSPPEFLEEPDNDDAGTMVINPGTYFVEAFGEHGTGGPGALEIVIR